MIDHLLHLQGKICTNFVIFLRHFITQCAIIRGVIGSGWPYTGPKPDPTRIFGSMVYANRTREDLDFGYRVGLLRVRFQLEKEKIPIQQFDKHSDFSFQQYF